MQLNCVNICVDVIVFVLCCVVIVMQGQFIGVVGKIGSGKTSLLSAITAEMCKVQGKVWSIIIALSYP